MCVDIGYTYAGCLSIYTTSPFCIGIFPITENNIFTVDFLQNNCFDNYFCGSRSDREFLYQIFGDVIEAGATTVVVADTVGITMPFEFGKLIADIKANTPGIEKAIIAVHCHNDLGHATANTIEVFLYTHTLF